MISILISHNYFLLIFANRLECMIHLYFHSMLLNASHDDVIKWKHFPRYWPFVRGIHRSPVNSPHKGQWRGALMFTLICVWINGCVNNREAGDLKRYCAHYGVTVMMDNHIYHTDSSEHIEKFSGILEMNQWGEFMYWRYLFIFITQCLK